MKCTQCSWQNHETDRFCSQCGVELDQEAEEKCEQECSSCGFFNAGSSTFCTQCGQRLQTPIETKQARQKHVQKPFSKKHRRSQKEEIKKTWNPALITLAIIGAGALIVALLFTVRSSREQQSYEVIETKSTDPAVETQVLEIASKFICSCGTCGEESLNVCTCSRAAEERQFIRNYLEMGQSPSQVIAALNATFGWIKPEFASLVGSGDSKAGVSSKLVVPEKIEPSYLQSATSPKPLARFATLADRVEIYSHFKCPCGQCGIDELNECTCSHPRGAKEVKGFIEAKIREGMMTIAQVVDEVSEQYGGKKF